jgi:predicted porin
MQKKLIVIAVAGALTAPALAFAQASTVQLYGRITAEYGYADQGNGRPNTDIFQTPGGSNVGVKGEEKLGGGLSAWFQCESSADVRGEGQNGFCTRNSAIGFKGGFGNVYMGKWDAPFKKAMSVGDGAGSEDTGLPGTAFLMAGSSTGTTNSTYGTGNPYGRHIWKRRQQESVNYITPNFSGFTATVAYSTGNAATSATNTTAAAKPRVVSVAGLYKNGPINIGVGYEQHSEFAVNGAGAALDDDAWVIAGSYSFGKVKVGAAYNEQTYENTTVGAGDMKKKASHIGVDWDLAGPHSVGGAWTHAETSGPSATYSINGTAQYNILGGNDADLYQIYYGHAFSKRTTAKLGYVQVDNDANAAYALGGLKGNKGQNQSAFYMLVKHVF